MPQERPNAFDFWDSKTLVGPELKPGEKDGVIRHVEYVPVGGREPNYDAALAVLKELT